MVDSVITNVLSVTDNRWRIEVTFPIHQLIPKKMFPFVILVLLGAAGQDVLAADDWWMKLPYKNNEFNYRAEYGQNIQIDCNDSSVPDGYNVSFWIRPDLVVMFPGDDDAFPTIDGPARWIVDNATGHMEIILVQESQFGFYYCVLVRNNSTAQGVYVVKKALNYEEAYFDDLWAKYEMNTIIGVSTGGGFFLISIALMLICKYHVDSNYDDGDDGDVMDFTDVFGEEEQSSGGRSSPQQGGGGGSREIEENVTKTPGYSNDSFVMNDEKVSEFFGLQPRIAFGDEITTDL